MLTLQPLINLDRLHTRDGDGTAAYQLYEALFQAAKTRTEASVDGRTISLGTIVHPGDDHREIVRWLWTILLADGIRALMPCRSLVGGTPHAVFHVRLGLSVTDLAHSTQDTQPVIRMIERSALDAHRRLRRPHLGYSWVGQEALA
ncbi:MAG: hypothetical protein M3308_07670 [Actinomycetota bacterium]|nr:hypothetical protein [Actinomycetota bacterium]